MRGGTQTAEALKELAWVATRCRDAAEFRMAAIAWVDRAIHVDAAILLQLDGPRLEGATGMGPRDPWIHGVIESLGTTYRNDFEQIMAALHGGRTFMAGRTSLLETWARLPDRQGLEEEMMFPLGLRIGSGGLIGTRGAPNGVLMLARQGRTRIFTDEEAELLSAAAPVVSLGLTLHQRRLPPPHEVADSAKPPEPRRLPGSHRLTTRERTVIEYVVLGLSCREIGLALGTSPNTIRNQLASIYQKLSVASRAELVAVALGEGIVEPKPSSGSAA